MITIYLPRIEKTRTSNLITNHEFMNKHKLCVEFCLLVSRNDEFVFCTTANCKPPITNIYFGFCSRIVKWIYGLYSLPGLPKPKYSNCTRDSSSKQVGIVKISVWLKTRTPTYYYFTRSGSFYKTLKYLF